MRDIDRLRGKVGERRALLDRRGFASSVENVPPVGQAANWFWDVARFVPPSGQHVARQLARLCGEDSEVSLPWRSLSDAVGVTDKAGRLIAYTQTGVKALERSGWLEVETVGRGRAAKTTFRLLPGDRLDYYAPEGDADAFLTAA